MEIHGQLDLVDYIRAQKLHMRPHPISKIILYTMIAVWAFISIWGIFSNPQGGSRIVIVVVAVVLLGVILLNRMIIFPRRARRIYYQQQDLQVPFRMEITESGLAISNEFSQANLPWSIFTSWKEDEQLFVFYHSENLFTVLPKRLVDQPDSVRNFLVENAVPVKKEAWCGSVIIIGLLILGLVYFFLVVWSR